jgi:hypothetical protein
MNEYWENRFQNLMIIAGYLKKDQTIKFLQQIAADQREACILEVDDMDLTYNVKQKVFTAIREAEIEK